jgi:hypothetical protein
LLHNAADAFEHRTGAPADPAWLEPPAIDVDDFWRMRRDLEGCIPNEPARDRAPPEEPVLGLMLLELRANGATEDGPYRLLRGDRIRVLRASNKLLHMVQAAFSGEAPPVTAPDIIIAVGAERTALAPHIVRGAAAPTIARGSTGRWLTRQEALVEFGL